MTHFTAINVLWYSDPEAARAQVASIPALEGAEEARAAAEARAEAEAAVAAAEAAAADEPSKGLYKYGEGGIEGEVRALRLLRHQGWRHVPREVRRLPRLRLPG